MNRVCLRKLGRLSKSYIAGKLLPLTESMGGNVFHEGKLYMLPKMDRDEISKLSTSRMSRLMRDNDDYVIGLEELKKVERGHFYDVQEDYRKASFIRDDLLEPVNSCVNLSLYKHDIVLSSKAFYDKTQLMLSSNLGGPGDTLLSGDAEDANYTSPNLASVESLTPGVPSHDIAFGLSELASSIHRGEKGSRSGSRAAITELTRKSSDKMKFTLRNSLCDFKGFVTLTYPRSFPRNGKTCKAHLNLFLNHLRKDYKGMKYFWFMEFQERGAPHFHIFLSCVLPGKTYVSPLWYRIVGSNDPSHLMAGTNVTVLNKSEDVVKYATSYAKKATQKMTPDDFSCVGRFWGCSRKLCESIMELTDISIRQIQELWSFYYTELGLPSTLRLDKLNGYIWNGRKYAAHLIRNYYEAHFRPLIAEVLMLSRVKPTSQGEILKDYEKERSILSYIRNMKKRVRAGSSVWKDLTKDQFETSLKKGTVRLNFLNGHYQHSLACAYSNIDEASMLESDFSVKDWSHWLSYLQLSMELNWAKRNQPLVEPVFQTHITTCKDGRIYKRKYCPFFSEDTDIT